MCAKIVNIGLILLVAPSSAIGDSELSGTAVEELRGILEAELIPAPDAALLGLLDIGNVEAVLRRLDSFSAIYDKRKEPSGALARESLTGIGAELVIREGRVLLLPRQFGPLAREGFSDLVELISIDGVAIVGLGATAIAQRLSGEPGSRVELVLVQPGSRRQVLMSVLRGPFKALDVELWNRGEMAVVRVTEFKGGRTRTALGTTLDLLSPTVSRVAIDLRFAVGGDLFEAIDAAGLFVERGSLLGVLHGRHGDPRPVYSVAHSRAGPSVALLVGPDTASAAEIFAGVLRFHGRAVLIGRPTFGKCSSQTERRLRDGSVLRFTNLEFRFPDGSTCSGVGLKPDVEVDQHVLARMESLLDEVSRLPVQAFDSVDNREGL
jgi:carboxyl-terminal processing protease